MSEQQLAVLQPRIHSANKRPLEDLLPIATPISAHIDISSVCNYKCSFCFQADTVGMKKAGLKRGFMSLELFKKIVDDFDAFPDKIKKIKIGNHGEPSLNPNFVDMIAYARASDSADIIEVFTNGSKLTPEINSGLISAGLQRINISLEGLTDERYYQVAGVRQNFQEIIDGVRDLYEQKQRANSDLKIYVKIADQAHALKKESTEIFLLSEQERKYFLDTFSPICDEIFIEKVVPQWAETQLDKQNEVSDRGMYDQEIKAWKEVCPFIFMYMHFNCDGTVSPCTLDWPRKVVIGNVSEQSVSEIWTGALLKELQVAMIAGKRKCVNFCGSCSAPMVCVEENLDPHLDKVIRSISAQKEMGDLASNRWLKTVDQVINFQSVER
ncbi:radical SAM protein with 4Fe4S-binding SPASM domain [Jezberella montanilacus]|uniref:Radical SAM protein with 4Fe4S-binding SPASM domain n=1 Tax=Jezberella montanilacus TaxID=323426 RepID=A0A2T0XI81_9BURK|nr:radical SAM/SPASM domain-containing protein [Jezberella montanilacus]PRY98664.1 radical SAM protein with 4Fe4S-binding SPASM domain [Jezberella montanilacus]